MGLFKKKKSSEKATSDMAGYRPDREWWPVPTSAFDYMVFLRDTFQFDTRWIPKVSQCKWERTRITLTYSV